MDRTKHDLSFNSTSLDYMALLKTAEIAFALSKREVGRHMNTLSMYPLKSCFYLDAQWLEDEAKHLSIAAETLYTLREGLSREELKVVNKPEVKEE